MSQGPVGRSGSRVLALLVSMLWLVAANVAWALKQELVALEPKQDTREVFVIYKLINTEPSDIYVLKWGTPLEGLNSPALAVFRNGTELLYEGILAKRGKPSAEDYIKIERGK